MNEIEAKNYVYGNIEAYKNIWSQWAPIFTDSEKYVVWLRRNAMSIWVCGLIDYLKKEEDRLEALSSFEAAESVKKAISLFDKTTKSILSELSEDLQIFIWFVRNQCLHGHLSLFYHDDLGIHIYDDKQRKIVKKKITRKEMSDSIDRANGSSKTLSDVLIENSEYVYFVTNQSSFISTEALDEYHKELFG